MAGRQTQPSYVNGFAPRDGRPAYPSLWQGLVGHWEAPLGNTGLIAHDVSGRGNNGTLSGATWEPSHFGPILRFDAANDRIVVPLTTLPVTDVTIACYALPIANSLQGQNNYVVYGPDLNSGWILLSDSNGALHVQIEVSAGSYAGRKTDNAIISYGNWYSLVATIESDGTAALFVNGIQRDTGASATDPFQPSGALWIGSRFSNYTAEIDHGYTAIYNRVLTPSEIQHLYADRSAITRLARRSPMVKAAAPVAGLSIPIAMHHYKQIMGVN